MYSDNNPVFLLLGGNLGDVKTLFQRALGELEQRVGAVCMQSPLYRSDPWGFTSENAFLNQVVCLNTLLSPRDLLREILDIEQKLGRQRDGNEYSSRPIDIDILFYHNRIIHTELLTIPHPRMHLRNFTLKPLNDIAPLWVHPVFGKTVSELLNSCEDTLPAEPI